MRQSRPSPVKKGSSHTAANRIRERYLHQLGLQRGGAPPQQQQQQQQHVVVISGLPSLPEERATTETTGAGGPIHDDENRKQPAPPRQDPDYMGDHEDQGDGAESESGSGHGRSPVPSVASVSTRSTTGGSLLEFQHDSVSPIPAPAALVPAACCRPPTRMALQYPTSLMKPVPPFPLQAPSRSSSLATHLSWQKSSPSLSKAALHVLANGGGDHDSVSSAATATTAESSHSALVSMDWGAAGAANNLHHSTTSTASVESGHTDGGTAPGVYFQHGHPAASSLTHALHRFNIDSDCEASSVASNSVAGCCGGSILTEDECGAEDFDEDASCGASQTSQVSFENATENPYGFISSNACASVGSKTNRGGSSRQLKSKKIGKAQRLMDRAVAHERILKVRSDRSRGLRASLVHSQRMNRGGLQHPPSPGPIVAPVIASRGTISLMHVQHGGDGSTQSSLVDPMTPLHKQRQDVPPPFPLGGPLGRTPTSSNCSAYPRRGATAMAIPLSHTPPPEVGPPDTTRCRIVPDGVHLSPPSPSGAHRPLIMPGLGAPGRAAERHDPMVVSHHVHAPPQQAQQSSTPQPYEGGGSRSSAPPSSAAEDIIEIAMALSILGGGNGGGVKA